MEKALRMHHKSNISDLNSKKIVLGRGHSPPLVGRGRPSPHPTPFGARPWPLPFTNPGSATGCMYGSIFIQIYAVGSKGRIFSAPESNRVHFGCSRSSKVDDLGTNRKRVNDFLLVGHCDYGPILHRFLDTTTYWLKNCLFFLPLSHLVPSLPMFPLEFCGEVKREETRVMGLSTSEDPMIVVVLTQCQRVTDRTDGQTDGFAIANTALCIASYADAL